MIGHILRHGDIVLLMTDEIAIEKRAGGRLKYTYIKEVMKDVCTNR